MVFNLIWTTKNGVSTSWIWVANLLSFRALDSAYYLLELYSDFLNCYGLVWTCRTILQIIGMLRTIKLIIYGGCELVINFIIYGSCELIIYWDTILYFIKIIYVIKNWLHLYGISFLNLFSWIVSKEWVANPWKLLDVFSKLFISEFKSFMEYPICN